MLSSWGMPDLELQPASGLGIVRSDLQQDLVESKKIGIDKDLRIQRQLLLELLAEIANKIKKIDKIITEYE